MIAGIKTYGGLTSYLGNPDGGRSLLSELQQDQDIDHPELIKGMIYRGKCRKTPNVGEMLWLSKFRYLISAPTRF